MIFGQGSMRCHPYLFEELQLLQSDDKANAVQKFDDLLFKHLAYTFNRGARSFAYGWTGGSSDAPQSADQFTASYYKTINRFSANFSLVSDMSLGLLAGDLKRKEMLSGRLADIHAHLFIATAILKFYEAGQKTEAEQLHAKLALQKAFLNIQEAFWGLFDNFPAKLPAAFVKWICFPLGRVISKPDDELKQQVAELMMEEHPFREQLKRHVYYSTKPNDVTGRLEHTFQMLRTLEPLWDKFKKAESKANLRVLLLKRILHKR
jgi:acyl-CoA dehydrogenase